MSKIIGVTVGTPLSADKLKEKIKPVTSVNGVKADESGNVEVKIPEQTGGDMQKSAYDASGAVAAAGGIPAYVTQQINAGLGSVNAILDEINGEVV